MDILGFKCIFVHVFSYICIKAWPRFLKGRLALIQNYKFVPFLYLPSYALLRVTFFVIITESRGKDEHSIR